MSEDIFEPAVHPKDGVWGTVDGVPVTDEVIERLADNAESGFPGVTPRPVGRPLSVGAKAARTVTVRLDDARAKAVKDRAEQDRVSASEVMRRALDRYLAS